MTASLAQIQKWREAYPHLQLDEAALTTAGPFPSLFVNDFSVYLESKGAASEVIQFVRDLARETVWVYGAWSAATRNNRPGALLADIINAARSPSGGGGHYDFVVRFLADYARANGIPIEGPSEPAGWESALTEMADADALD